MRGVVLLLFVVAPIADLVLLVILGRAVGVLPVLVLVLGTVSMGMVLVRAQGIRTLGALTRELAIGRIPGRQMLDGLAILLGGGLLIAPGLLTDLAGLALLFRSHSRGGAGRGRCASGRAPLIASSRLRLVSPLPQSQHQS